MNLYLVLGPNGKLIRTSLDPSEVREFVGSESYNVYTVMGLTITEGIFVALEPTPEPIFGETVTAEGEI